MPLPVPPRQLTYDDYAALPDDGKRYELIDGVLYVVPSPTFWHQNVAFRIATDLALFLRSSPLGVVVMSPFDVVLNPPASTRAWQPDVLYVANERRHLIREKQVWGAPDLVVEVLSSNASRDLGAKKRAYQDAGVKEYWVAWQDMPRIEVYRLGESGGYGNPQLYEAGQTLMTNLLPGFELTIDAIYQGLEEPE